MRDGGPQEDVAFPCTYVRTYMHAYTHNCMKCKYCAYIHFNTSSQKAVRVQEGPFTDRRLTGLDQSLGSTGVFFLCAFQC